MHYIDMRLLIQHDTSSFKTQVLMFEWQPSRNLYVYTANIPPGLLDKLDNPATSFHSCPVEIRCRKIPLKHSKSVINRLHNIFCPGSCACCTG
ncbi:hypothetical protein BDV25DRAFT_147319 [Aspergillus avenaceus]|uniref:Uncharacterized protein n=1 Tax=Aspergillus avenaceus TaxID=36643 RepID=A0A5N6U8I2_ASPAV|nr:hypothetical protein BDV25DRAFT_147319 [Aspergillus avenaceus]